MRHHNLGGSKMIIHQKRTCERCKAIDYHRIYPICLLGYKVKPKEYKGSVIGAIPLEPCPKPLTYSDYDVAGQEWGKSH